MVIAVPSHMNQTGRGAGRPVGPPTGNAVKAAESVKII
jgi:hypothetical protein